MCQNVTTTGLENKVILKILCIILPASSSHILTPMLSVGRILINCNNACFRLLITVNSNMEKISQKKIEFLIL
jgi:hypothetical protein